MMFRVRQIGFTRGIGWLLGLASWLAHAQPKEEIIASIETYAEAANVRFDLIRNVERELYLTAFDFEGGDRSVQILLAEVRDRAREGKRVVLVLDAFQHNLSPAQIAVLVEAGVEVYLYNPPNAAMPTTLYRRSHLKGISADRKRAIHTDRNMADAYLGLGDEQMISREIYTEGHSAESMADSFDHLIREGTEGGWMLRIGRDGPTSENLTIRVAKKILGTLPENLREKFRRKWGLIGDLPPVAVEEAGRALDQALARLPKRVIESGKTWRERLRTAETEFYFDSPGMKGAKRGTDEAVLAAINRAQKAIVLENAYFVPTPELVEALTRAVRERGVHLTVYANSKVSLHGNLTFLTWDATRAWLAGLGADVFESEGFVADGASQRAAGELAPEEVVRTVTREHLHAKTVIVDMLECLVMSFNLDPRSQNLNLETGLRVVNRGFAETCRQLQLKDQVQRHFRKTVAGGKLVGKASSLCARTIRAIVAFPIRSQLR